MQKGIEDLNIYNTKWKVFCIEMYFLYPKCTTKGVRNFYNIIYSTYFKLFTSKFFQIVWRLSAENDEKIIVYLNICEYLEEFYCNLKFIQIVQLYAIH